MDEFIMDFQDWDLQAVVRSSSSSPSLFNPTQVLERSRSNDYSDFVHDMQGLSSGCYCMTCLNHEAPVMLQHSNNSSSLISATQGFKETPKIKQPQLSAPTAPSAADIYVAQYVPKLKRSKKNQHSKMVKQVTEDGLSSDDKWAWRKYGQKPIKGSPYPRSYYRCSSLKGCQARKQVERSSANPSIFIVTYTAEHSHPHPTRRNSLAGTTRSKSATKPIVKKDDVIPSANLHTFVSTATTRILDSNVDKDAVMQIHETIKIEEDSSGSTNEFDMRDLVFSDELYPSLEDFEGFLFMDHEYDTLLP